MTEETYTDRYVAWHVVDKLGENSVQDAEGGGCYASDEVVTALCPGKEYELEQRNNSWGRITGFRIDGKWYDRKSDQDLERQWEEYLAAEELRKQTLLEKNLHSWGLREAALPDWIKERMQTFHERGGAYFRLNGWGYELVICELAVLYLESEGIDTPEIDQYAENEGTSGNQHGMAKALAKAHEAGESLAGTVGGLSVIDGDAFYEGKK